MSIRTEPGTAEVCDAVCAQRPARGRISGHRRAGRAVLYAHRQQPPVNVTSVVGQVNPGVVDVNSDLADNVAERQAPAWCSPAGGEVLTNNHVIDGATSVQVVDIGNPPHVQRQRFSELISLMMSRSCRSMARRNLDTGDDG